MHRSDRSAPTKITNPMLQGLSRDGPPNDSSETDASDRQESKRVVHIATLLEGTTTAKAIETVIMGPSSTVIEIQRRRPFARAMAQPMWPVVDMLLSGTALVLPDFISWQLTSSYDVVVGVLMLAVAGLLSAMVFVHDRADRTYSYKSKEFWADSFTVLSLCVEGAMFLSDDAVKIEFKSGWSLRLNRGLWAATTVARADKFARALRFSRGQFLLDALESSGTEDLGSKLSIRTVYETANVVIGCLLIVLVVTVVTLSQTEPLDVYRLGLQDLCLAAEFDNLANPTNAANESLVQTCLSEIHDDQSRKITSLSETAATLFYLKVEGAVLVDRRDASISSLRKSDRAIFCKSDQLSPVDLCNDLILELSTLNVPSIAAYDISTMERNRAATNLVLICFVTTMIILITQMLTSIVSKLLNEPVHQLIRAQRSTEVLLELCKHIRGLDKEADLLPVLVTAAKQIVDAEIVNIFFLESGNTGTDILWCQHDENDDSPYISGLRIPVGKHAVGRCAQNRCTIHRVYKTTEDVDSQDPSMIPSIDKHGTNSIPTDTKDMLCTPLISSAGHVVGVIQAINKKSFRVEGHTFDPFDSEMLEEFGRIARPVLQRLKQDATQRNALVGSQTDTELHDLLDEYSTTVTTSRAMSRRVTSAALLSAASSVVQMRKTAKLNSNSQSEHWPQFKSLRLPDSANYSVWGFPCLDYSLEQLIAITCLMYKESDMLDEFAIDSSVLYNFVKTALSTYRNVPYHNAWHAFFVTQSCFWICKSTQTGEKFSKLEQFAMYTAALTHDAGHDGVNTSFHVAVCSEIALMYNDKSPLESMHSRKCFEIMREPACDILGHVSEEQQRQIRGLIIDAILGTDMSYHSEHLSALVDHQQPELNMDSTIERSSLLPLLVHGCDIASAAMPWQQCQRWARLVATEFQAQVDLEQACGLQASAFMDLRCGRSKEEPVSASEIMKAFATGQTKFAGFILMPYLEQLFGIVPEFQQVYEQCESNRRKWVKVQNGMQLETKANIDEEKILWSANLGSIALGTTLKQNTMESQSVQPCKLLLE